MSKHAGWKELRISNVTKTFHGSRSGYYCAVKDINITIRAGDFYCLLGPSGCGKTTILNMIAGFEMPSTGIISFDESPILGPGTDRAVIFQDVTNALFPWLTVLENIEFGPKVRKVPASYYRESLQKYLGLVDLEKHVHKFPFELSGGMKQRVQIARALVNDPDVLLMDEPFAALDAITKRILQRELVRIWQSTGKTIFYITHDIVEALILGTRVAVMTAGPGAGIKHEVELQLKGPKAPTDPDFCCLQTELERLIQHEVEGVRSDEQQPGAGSK